MTNTIALRPTLAAADGPLGSDDLAHYERTGWLTARAFFGTEEAEAIAAWTDELLGMPERPGAQMVYRENSLLDPSLRVVQRIEDFCPHHPAFDALIRGGRLQAAVDQLLGGPSVLFKEKINFKMPGGAGFEPHQDQQAGWSAYAPIFVTVLVSIDQATVENGCLEIADAPRFAGLIGEEWRPLTAEQMAGFALLPVPTEPGDVLFFDSYVPHASGPNLTAEARRILYLTYNRAADGDHRARYFADKRASFPPDIERKPGVEYKFRV
ncbi:phytanoyl-CoA dioxygenase family protein [Dankookia sp. GCM10030260]|uniref:phytanoyl-CoA dioxygenase family protein n=1 Tax=Dankookia sp. GCM10030260 TaxID=3273390 RepID=UPI00361F7CE5